MAGKRNPRGLVIEMILPARIAGDKPRAFRQVVLFDGVVLERATTFAAPTKHWRSTAIPDDGGSGAITLPGSRVEFDSRGLTTPMGTGGVIYLRHEVKATAVTAIAVSPAGSIRLWTWRNGAWE